MLRPLPLLLLVLSAFVASTAQAQNAHELAAGGDEAQLVLAVDCRAIYNDPTFDAIMDLVEASEAFTQNAEPLAAWGFDPRADIHELVFVVADLGSASGEFLIAASGDLSAEEINAQLEQGEHLTAGSDERGTWWERDTVRFVATADVAIIGVGLLFDRARAALLDGFPLAWGTSEHAIELRVAIDEDLRAAHPALGPHLVDLVASISLGREPTFRLRAETPNEHAATSAVAELAQILQSVLDVPEVRAMGLDGLLENAQVVADGRFVSVTAVLNAESWARFSTTLSELIAEELR